MATGWNDIDLRMWWAMTPEQKARIWPPYSQHLKPNLPNPPAVDPPSLGRLLTTPFTFP